MAAANVQPLIDQTRSTRGVLESAKVWFDGQTERLERVKQEALANGATEEELQPLSEEISLTRQVSDQVAQALAANP